MDRQSDGWEGSLPNTDQRTDRQTGQQTNRRTDRQTHTYKRVDTVNDASADTQTHAHVHIWTGAQTDRQAGDLMHTHARTHTHTHTRARTHARTAVDGSQANGWADRRTEGQWITKVGHLLLHTWRFSISRLPMFRTVAVWSLYCTDALSIRQVLLPADPSHAPAGHGPGCWIEMHVGDTVQVVHIKYTRVAGIKYTLEYVS